MHKTGISVALALLLGSAIAETDPFVAFEAAKLDITIAKDGTGVVSKVYCKGCKFNQVKITPQSRAYIDGVEVGVLRARERAGKSAMVAFDPYTREVQTIRWNQ
jgi:hypothetical protein